LLSRIQSLFSEKYEYLLEQPKLGVPTVKTCL
jgi:hypothetical protein